jgi:superoxide dismutase, Cu-Zn family
MTFSKITGLALLLSCVFGCGGSDDDEPVEPEMIASSEGARLMVYADPYAPDNAGAPNPIPPAANAAAHAFDIGGQLRIQLAVAGFPADRTFGSHLHRLECLDPSKAGGHYQHMPFPEGGMATDPEYANAMNEAWLDFTTDADGEAVSDLTLDWLPRSGEAKAIIIHDMRSGVGGVSGPKLACLPITGF